MKKLGKLETTTHGPHVSLCSTMLLFWMSVLKFWNAESWIPWFPWVKPLGFQAPNSPRWRLRGRLTATQTKVPCSSYHHNAHPACLAFWVQWLFFGSSFEKRKWPYSLKRQTFGRVLKAVTSSTAPKIGIQEETQPEIRAWLQPFSLRQPEC